jgi:hypothetical protein
MTKEEFYDEKISPLMAQIIAMCKEGEIPMVADFALDWSEDEQSHLKCTTVILGDELDPPDEMLAAARVLRGHGQSSPMMLTIRDADGNAKEMHAIL